MTTQDTHTFSWEEFMIFTKPVDTCDTPRRDCTCTNKLTCPNKFLLASAFSFAHPLEILKTIMSNIVGLSCTEVHSNVDDYFSLWELTLRKTLHVSTAISNRKWSILCKGQRSHSPKSSTSDDGSRREAHVCFIIYSVYLRSLSRQQRPLLVSKNVYCYHFFPFSIHLYCYESRYLICWNLQLPRRAGSNEFFRSFIQQTDAICQKELTPPLPEAYCLPLLLWHLNEQYRYCDIILD